MLKGISDPKFANGSKIEEPAKKFIRRGYRICKKSVSWSKNGFIAFVPPSSNSKYNLQLTYLQNLDGQKWGLYESQCITIKPSADSITCPDLTLVEWNNSSTDLAVADFYGNFYILLAGVNLVEPKANINGNSNNATGGDTNTPSYELTSYNHMEMIYRDVYDSNPSNSIETDHQICCFKWLEILKPFKVMPPPMLETKSNSGEEYSFSYDYSSKECLPAGLSHPINTKQACMVLRSDGELTLYHQGEHKVEYHKVSINLSFKSENPHISRASIGFKNNCALIVAFDESSNAIKVFEAQIDWGFLLQSAKRQKVDPHYRTPENLMTKVTISVRTLHEMRPFPSYISGLEHNLEHSDNMDVDGGGQTTDEYRIGELSDITLISPSWNDISDLDILISYNFISKDRKEYSTIYRYNLTSMQQTINKVFYDLGGKEKSVTQESNGNYAMVLHDSKTLRGYLNEISSSISNNLLLLRFEDGKVNVVDRFSLKVLSGCASSKKTSFPPQNIANVFDLGYDIPKLGADDGELLAISPNLTTFVYFKDGNSTKNVTLKYIQRDYSKLTNPKELYVISVCFAYLYSSSCNLNVCGDDLMAFFGNEFFRLRENLNSKLAPSQTSVILDRLIESIVLETNRAMGFQYDMVTKEPVDKLLSNSPLQKILSLQLYLSGMYTKNPIMSDIAWIILNIRCSSFGIMFSMSSIYRQISKKKPNEETLKDAIMRADCIMSLIGNVKWLIDLMIYINQELLQLGNSKKQPAGNKLKIQESLALPMLMSKVLRVFLIYVISLIAKTHEILKELNRNLTQANKMFSPMKDAMNRYFTTCSQSPLNMGLFEIFLRECDKFVTEETSKALKDKDRNFITRIEHKLFSQGEIHPEIMSVAEGLVEKHHSHIRKDIKISDIYFYDSSWLKIGIYSPAKEGTAFKSVIPRLQIKPTECVDALRKVAVPLHGELRANSPKIRRCTRCRSFSLVDDPVLFESSSRTSLWTIVFQRTCLCGSIWVNFDA